MKNIILIMKKELNRVFKDKRLIFATIIMPGLMIFLMYTLMGEAITNINQEEEEKSKIVAVNMNDDLKGYLDVTKFNYELINIEGNELINYKDKLLNAEVDAIIAFPENFTESISYKQKPNINTYYNPGETLSSNTINVINAGLNTILSSYVADEFGDIELFTINVGNNESEIFANNKMIGKIVSLMLPFLIITFLFSGAMSVAPEAIAGEKERGTIATLLATPTKRRDIALGKITGLSIISTLSAISSFIGILISLPKIMGLGEEVNLNEIYGFSDYVLVFAILVSTVLLIVSLISVVSAFAKNLKESNTFILPLYFISMGIGITSMFSQNAQTNYLFYFIPLYNSLQCLVGIFTFEYSILNLLITIIINLTYTGLLVFALSKMFNNEKIMFAK